MAGAVPEVLGSGSRRIYPGSPLRKSRVRVPETAALRREMRRTLQRKTRDLQPLQAALVDPPAYYPNKRERVRADRKRTQAIDTQQAVQHLRPYTKPSADWNVIISDLDKHTPVFDLIVDFQVVLDKGVAADIFSSDGGAVDNLRIVQKDGCILRLQDQKKDKETTTLFISGSQWAVRTALTGLLKLAGRLSAVRVPDPGSQKTLQDLVKKKETSQLVKLLRENAPGWETHDAPPVVREAAYKLCLRADLIKRPKTWTKASLEQYVAKLVYAQIPRPLYSGQEMNHQETVAAILVGLFQSPYTRPALSTRTLDLSLNFLTQKGISFRHAAHTIFQLAELAHVPIDTTTYNIMLHGCNVADDLDGFQNMLKRMIKKGNRPDSRTWIELLYMIRDIKLKNLVLENMKKKGLYRIQSALVKVGSHLAPIELEASLKSMDDDITPFITRQDAIYEGPHWLDTLALNQMLEIFGRHGRHKLSYQLLDLVAKGRRGKPDVVSINTMLTHVRSSKDIHFIIQTMQQRWGDIKLDEITYHMLFERSWKLRGPNQLRVVWRYACYAREASSKMRAKMTRLLILPHKNDLHGKAIFKEWEENIFGPELAPLRAEFGQYVQAKHLCRVHIDQRRTTEPAVDLGSKLMEAYAMDSIIHARYKDGEIMTPEVRESLTVGIPMKPCTSPKP